MAKAPASCDARTNLNAIAGKPLINGSHGQRALRASARSLDVCELLSPTSHRSPFEERVSGMRFSQINQLRQTMSLTGIHRESQTVKLWPIGFNLHLRRRAPRTISASRSILSDTMSRIEGKIEVTI
jgi:hypothetical protein